MSIIYQQFVLRFSLENMLCDDVDFLEDSIAGQAGEMARITPAYFMKKLGNRGRFTAQTLCWFG